MGVTESSQVGDEADISQDSLWGLISGVSPQREADVPGIAFEWTAMDGAATGTIELCSTGRLKLA
jgi:hypothetical protein